MHYGNKNPNFVYNIGGHVLQSADSVNDLGVLRSANFNYNDHCINVISRANRTCAYILRVFVTRSVPFMSLMFVAYVRPMLEYACQLWSPNTVELINRLERVQRLFS